MLSDNLDVESAVGANSGLRAADVKPRSPHFAPPPPGSEKGHDDDQPQTACTPDIWLVNKITNVTIARDTRIPSGLPSPPTPLSARSGSNSPTVAALALFTHAPPPFETSSPVPRAYPYAEHKQLSKLSRRPSLSGAQLFSLLAFLAILVLQFFRPYISLPELPSIEVARSRPPRTASTEPVCANDDPFTYELPVSRPHKMSLLEEAKRVAAEFEYPAEDVVKGVEEFRRQMDEGLGKVGATMSQIPTYVTAVPNGTEKGLYLAIDLGGTNFRVCSIQLHGNTTFSLTQSKVAIPHELMVAKTAQELFAFLAKQIETFLRTHHNDHFEAHIQRRKTFSNSEGYEDEEIFSLGFTFSFPIQQISINRGTLIRWTKGFDIDDAIGKDVCALLQDEIDKLHLPVKVAALVNDTVGTLMARSYTSPGKTGTLLGAIFGTGTNGAYVEKLSKITKLAETNSSSDYDKSTGEMIVNTEWGSFDNALHVLPSTPYDKALDAESVNPGIQMFEKRVSGMFLGEVLRRAILGLMENDAVQLFRDESSGSNDQHSTATIADDSPLYQQWGIDTSFLSIVQEDQSKDLRITRQVLDKDLGVSAASTEDAEAVKTLVAAVGRRSARLSAVAIGAVVLATGRLEQEGEVDVGVDGSLVEHYPGFEVMVREALREVPGIGPEGEQRVRIGIAKDGSGVGAALIALVASQMEGV